MRAQQHASKSDRRAKMKTKFLKCMWAELERKLDAFQRVQSILDDHKSNGLGDYEEEMKNIYGKDGFFCDEFNAVGNIYNDWANYTTGVVEDNKKLDFWHYMEDNTNRLSQYVEVDAYRRYQTWKESELIGRRVCHHVSHHFSRVDETLRQRRQKSS